MSADTQTIELALIAIAALALLLQTIFLVAVLAVARKAVRSMREEMEHYRSSLTPIILKTREVMQNIAPKIEETVGELNAMSKMLRAQTADIQAAADEIIARTQHQVGRVDSMLTSIFDRVERAGSFMSDAVSKPMRQLSGLIASVRAAVETLRDPDAVPTHAPRYTDGDHMPGPRATGTTTPFRP